MTEYTTVFHAYLAKGTKWNTLTKLFHSKGCGQKLPVRACCLVINAVARMNRKGVMKTTARTMAREWLATERRKR